MYNKYFDRWEFTKAISAVYDDPIEAKRLLENYMDKYPSDYSAVCYYIYDLVILGYIEEANYYYNKMDSLINNGFIYSDDEEKLSYIKKGLVLNKLRLLARDSAYEEFYTFCIRNSNIIDDFDYSKVLFHCRSRLGLVDNSKPYSSYLKRQVTNYSEQDFLSHIKRHTADYNMNLSTPNPSVFASDFPILKVIEEVKKNIPSDKGLGYGFFDDTYYFKYDDCGREKGKLVDYFKVVCFHDTFDLITMRPTDECEKYPFTDLNYLIDDNKPKVKTISQIEKFNKKYRR